MLLLTNIDEWILYLLLYSTRISERDPISKRVSIGLYISDVGGDILVRDDRMCLDSIYRSKYGIRGSTKVFIFYIILIKITLSLGLVCSLMTQWQSCVVTTSLKRRRSC